MVIQHVVQDGRHPTEGHTGGHANVAASTILTPVLRLWKLSKAMSSSIYHTRRPDLWEAAPGEEVS